MLHNWENYTVLITEDDEMSYRYLELLLTKKTNINIIWATTGIQAVEYCKIYDKIDLVLMDLQLPELDGYEATKQIKAFNKTLPIIIQTANSMNDEEKRCMDAGCNGYVTKPISSSTLISCMEKHLNPITV